MLDNAYRFVKTTFKDKEFKQNTQNVFKVVSVKNYVDKKGKLPDGFKITLTVLKDSTDYGVDDDGNKIYDNVGQTFDVTVLSRDVRPERGQLIRLGELDEEHTFYIQYNLILRYKNIEIYHQQSQKQA